MKKEIREKIWNVFLFSLLGSINIFFGIFVWLPYDLSPNFALLFVTGVPMIILLFKIFKKKEQRGDD